MFRSVYLRVFALYLLLAIYWLRKVNAKVVLSGNNVTGRAYPSTDYYLRPETHYHYSGVALYWEFRYDPSKEVCTFTPVDTTDNDLQDIARTASDYTHFAIALNYPRSVYTECVDKNQMDEATRTFFEQLAKIGFPTVKLFLLLGHPGKIAYIVDDYIIHNDPNAFRKYIRSVPVTVAAVKPDKKIDLPETKVGNYTRFFYRVEQEDNGWNRIMLSPEKILYKWICYALLLLVLVYSVARTTRLITLRLLQFNLFTSAYIVAVIYAIFLLLHYIAPYNYAVLDNATFIYSFLSRLPFDMVLWHWSIVGRNLFSRRSVLLFRLIITIDLLSNFFRFGFMIANISQPEDLDNRLQLYQDLITITSVAIPAISTAIFGGFTLWFIWCSYKLSKHPNGRSRFIQLAFFSAVGFVTYWLFLSCVIMRITRPIADPQQFTYLMEVVFDVSYLMRALVFLLMLGIDWPKPKEDPTMPVRIPVSDVATPTSDVRNNRQSIHGILTRKLTKKSVLP